MANGRLNLTDEQIRPLFTPRLYGLLDTATELPDLPPHWQQGLTWEPLCPDSYSTYSRCLVITQESDDIGEAPDPPEKDESTFNLIRGALPFTVVDEIHCNPTAGPERIRRWAAEALIRSEQRQVEETFWTGVAANQQVVFPHLAADTELVEPEAGGAQLQLAADVVFPSPLPVHMALGALEAGIADCYDGIGTIHVPVELMEYLAEASLITTQAGVARTKLGNKVVAGAGYPGTSPAGAAPTEGTLWIYATGEVFYKRGEIFQPSTVESFDRARNTIKAQAERTYVIGWNCCLLAVQVDLLLP